MSRIVVVTGMPPCRNPRVRKEASALAAAGYAVTVLAPSLSRQTAAEDADIVRGEEWRRRPTVELHAGGMESLRPRLVRRLGSEAVRRLGVQAPQSLGYGVRRTLRMARDLDADLYIGHTEPGLWVVDRLAREGRRVGVDIEDWYSEDLLPEARRRRPLLLLRRLEKEALRRGGHVTTTSGSLAGALARRHVARPPTVIYNAFSWSDRLTIDQRYVDRRDHARPSLHWVSRTVGPGRGLETLFSALREVRTPVEVHLRGACTVREEERLRGLFPTIRDHRLLFHGLVPNEELLSRISEHDVGLALEPDEPANKQHTVSNKILHSLLAGLPVVATATSGQREVAAGAPGAVWLCRSSEPASMARAINRILASPETLAGAKGAALEAARTRFCWERQVPVLLDSVERALHGRRRSSCGVS